MKNHHENPACLIPLPGGLGVSGVARFTARLANGLAARGRHVGVILHTPTAVVPPLALPVDGRVAVFDCSDLPPIESTDPEHFIERYSAAVDQLAGGGPVSLVLGQHAGPFAVAAKLANARNKEIRSIGVAHSDNGYDTRVLAHYEPILNAMVGVSSVLASALGTAMTDRISSIERLPYGVEVPPSLATREPMGDRPLRLLYAGRLDHRQKRVLTLPVLAAELDRRSIAHELTIVGDGPAADALRSACGDTPSITLHPPASPQTLSALLDSYDAFVLPSRFEGLSVAMLEALAHGCIPVVTPSRSGTAEAVRAGRTGEVADATPDDDEDRVGLALADAIDALRRRDLGEMSARCRAHAAERFAIGLHIDRWIALLDRVAADDPRSWPGNRSVLFNATGSAGTTGSVPTDAAERFLRVINQLGGAPIAVHGAGAHTQALAEVIPQANVVCITDDDRQRYGETMLGIPIIDPKQAAALGATRVVVSSHLHESDIWRRRSVYESQGLQVHRLYGPYSDRT
ncbi:MAG: glycosyltransferase family 4 protein [Planctomycetota bacterium]